jgi:hypothetical protein
MKVKRLDLGRGLVGEDARFTFEVTPEGMGIRDLTAGLAGGRLAGALAITRQGAQAAFAGEGTVTDVALPALIGPGGLDGRLNAALKFGASGETLSSAAANLAGVGDVRVSDVSIPSGDPEGLGRALPRLLRDEDPLGGGKVQALVTDELSRGPLPATSVAAPATMVGGTLRIGPVTADTGSATWQGAIAVDLKTAALDARGSLTARNPPKAWTAGQPYVLLGWKGPFGSLRRDVDVAPLVNALAAVVLKRELERVEAFEADANERLRLNQRLGMDRERRAAEEAARRAAEEAERQARLRAQQEAEAAARAREAERAPASDRTTSSIPYPPPVDIRPPAQARPPGG